MADCFVLLPRRQMALIVLLSAAARIEKEFGKLDVVVAPPVAFLVVDKSPEPNERSRVMR